MSSTASIANRRRLDGCSMATALSIESIRDHHTWVPTRASYTCRAETAGTALGLIERRLLGPLQPGHRGHHQLRDAIAAADGEDLLSVIDQDHADFAAIIGVDRARRIQGGDAVLQ